MQILLGFIQQLLKTNLKMGCRREVFAEMQISFSDSTYVIKSYIYKIAVTSIE